VPPVNIFDTDTI